MKRYFLLISFCIMVISACKKDSSKPLSADFTTSVKNAYLGQTVTFKANAQVSSKDTCWWDYGEGPNSPGLTGSYTYTNPGIYTVTFTVNHLKSTQKIRVYPGTFSFQVKNSTGVDLTSIDMYPIIKSGSVQDYQYKSFPNGTTLDTVFVNMPAAEFVRPMRINGFFVSAKNSSIFFDAENGLSTFNGHVIFQLNTDTMALFEVANTTNSVSTSFMAAINNL